MSDTPRTDSKRSGDKHFMGDWVDANFACKLEMELNAANERIKRLEEAGDRLAYWYEPKELRQFDALNNWKQAKEDKP